VVAANPLEDITNVRRLQRRCATTATSLLENSSVKSALPRVGAELGTVEAASSPLVLKEGRVVSDKRHLSGTVP
jgi:hypothetical protein